MNIKTYSDNPDVLSFSSGRTSGMMVERWLEKSTNDVVVCFCNTGLEDEKSLLFAYNCTVRWKELYGIEVVWLEYCRHSEVPAFKIVDYTTASRKGEPFAALLEYRNNLPNIVARYCTAELKVRTIKRYMLSIGVKHWTNVVGIRYDEKRRWTKTKGIALKERFDISMPLVDQKVIKHDVLTFWKGMPFDLEIESELFGNCNLCFLKGKGKKKKILRQRPELAEFWLEWENKRSGYTFYKDFSVQQLLNEVVNSPELFDDIDNEEDIQCLCNSD